MPADRLLRTGEAASRLGVSRQHVVDLCKQGKLPYVMVGVHRRIPEHAITSKLTYMRHPRNDGKQQSLWLHAALIPKLVNDPDTVLEIARRNLARQRQSGSTHSAAYTDEWASILDAGVGRVIEAILDPSDHGATLRSCTPFTGVLNEEEVRSIKKAYREVRDAVSSG
ncbi:helix-turn-helix domain-containing protein [Mycobacterium sp. pUA109]|uniref:helix-turn-helix domain-containing protein n=1 Tax=Mycobacterium sp. pUA109 TaxID=3238982 RepID=UPI00351B232D